MMYVLIPFLPLAAFVVVGLFGHWIKERAHLIAVPAVVGSLVLSIVTFWQVADGDRIAVPLYTWLTSGDLKITLGLFVDRLTAVMLLLVTIVSSLVHVYTIGYMRGEPGYARFFAYIALFTFSMLMLVMADNFLQLFVFWEAVGLCSYLLIGHWYDRPSAVGAATKAFVVNRIGDFGFLLGLLLVWLTFGSLDYRLVFAQAGDLTGATVNLLAPFGGTWAVSTLTVICLLLFTGAVGKSAQFPLHVWLPDAMEGPTPISALIHAATMVTAGVFMLVRVAFVIQASQTALSVIAWVGTITAAMAALIATQQNDIKRILAYSTISQLGYMMMAVGLASNHAAMFHLFNHAFFKALLFLCAGSVIHLVETNEMFEMGGLGRRLPLTTITMTIASLSLAGLPPFSGFWSKDEILGAALARNPILFVLALATVGMTAFYMFRVIFLTFSGSF